MEFLKFGGLIHIAGMALDPLQSSAEDKEINFIFEKLKNPPPPLSGRVSF